MGQKVALVTGASRGIGAAIAKRLAADGMIVAVHYGSNRSAADAVVAEIAGAGGSAFAVQADMGKVADIQAMFTAFDTEVKKRTGEARFDVLVNNAGIAPAMPLEAIDEAAFDSLFAINVKGPLFAIQAAEKRLRDGGRIINISTGLTRFSMPGYAAYSATKGALDILTRDMAGHFGPRGITVNAVAPGVTETDIVADWLNSDSNARGFVSSITALGRLGQGKDIASVVSFLASEDGGWMTGTWLEASGGMRL